MRQQERKKEMEKIFSLMGLGLATLHEIEQDFAKSTLIALTDSQRKKHETINDLWEARSSMTFGQLIRIFKEQWSLKPEFEFFLDRFLEERNALVHDLTTQEGHNPRYKRQREKLKKRLLEFVDMAFLARRIFRAAFFASNDFASWWLKEHKDIDIPLPSDPEIDDEISFFMELLEKSESAEL